MKYYLLRKWNHNLFRDSEHQILANKVLSLNASICMSNVLIFNKYKTFSVLIYSYINTSGNWENEKLCGNTMPEGQSVFTQFRVFPISTSVDITIYQYRKYVLYLFYNIAQRNILRKKFSDFPCCC